MGAPSLMSASYTTNRSSADRPWPPYSVGHVIPIQPRRASSREKSLSGCAIQESSWNQRPSAASRPT